MNDTLQCISLRTVRYGESGLMVTAYSRSRGRVSIAVKNGGGREDRRRRAIMQPGGIFECVPVGRPQAQVLRVRDVRLLRPLPGVMTDPLKMIVATFCCDALAALTADSGADEPVYDFAVEAFAALDGMTGTALANFPVLFLYKLGRYLGIEPDGGDWRPGRVFDLVSATFAATPPTGHTHFLMGEEARAVALLGRIGWRSAHLLRLTREQRRRMLDLTLLYYDLHYRRLSSLTTLSVIRDILG